MRAATDDRSLPLWLKLAYTGWFLIWVPAYWIYHGPANFLWLCDIANIVVAAAVWLESPLLFSSQAVSVLLIQLAWLVDVGTRAIAGFHPIGGTEYMFDPAEPELGRVLSLFHVFMPVMLLWCVWRLGLDRRGWKLQTVLTALVLPVSFLVGTPESNLNWLWAPFGIEQVWLPSAAFLIVCMIAYPVVLYLPTQALLVLWLRRAGRPLLPLAPTAGSSRSGLAAEDR